MREKRQHNPYIFGTVIKEQEKFYGRESLFRLLEDNLAQGVKVILLHGQRRICKSSVLKQIPHRVGQDKFVFVPFDLQDKSQSSLSKILHKLATEIVDHLQLDKNRVQFPEIGDLNNDLNIFSSRFLPLVYQEIGDKNLVFLLDEFDVSSEGNPTINQDNNANINIAEQGGFFHYLAGLWKQHEKLFIIPVIGRYLNDVPNLRKLFKEAPYQEIGLLDEDSAKRLITKPPEGNLTYSPDAIKSILRLSAGHPYFTQAICFAIFGRARELNKWEVSPEDVEATADKAIELADGGLGWFWDGLLIPEQVVFSAVAEAQKLAIQQKQSVPETPLDLLRNYGVITQPLDQTAKRLAEKGFLDDTERRVKVELVRRWLVQFHPLQTEIRQLEKLEQESVSTLSSAAVSLRQQGKSQDALALYKQALTINPNHFNTVVSLAKGYSEVSDFDNALKHYERAFQFNPALYKDELLQVRENYGHWLITQKDFAKAKQQYQRVLEIQPDRVFAQDRLDEIAAYQSGNAPTPIQQSGNVSMPIQLPTVIPPTPPVPEDRIHLPWRRQQIIGGSIAIAALAIAATVLSVYQFSISCPPGEQKEFVGCTKDPNRISSGERTLFPSHRNTNRDLGIRAFKQGNYLDAVQYFEKAVAENHTDPEVLIYYNNALAHQQGSPVTLAAVVPADNQPNLAEEMLRGVALAQDKFNKNRGLNGRFLEVVIANDGNERDKAKQVAQALVQKQNVLAVIGHSSSEATQAALQEYEKARLAIISPTSTSTSLSGEVFFRTVPSNAAIGKKLAEYTLQKLNIKKVVIAYNSDSPYSNSLRESFTNTFKELKGQVADFKIDLSNANIGLQAKDKVAACIWTEKVQAVMLFPDVSKTDLAIEIAKVSADMLAQPKSQKIKGLKFLGGNSLYSQQTLSDGGKAVEGMILAVPWFRNVQESTNFAKNAEEKWGGGVSWRTATSFDATKTFIKSLSPEPNRNTVLQRLPKVELLASETSAYPLKFTNGERQSEPILVVIEKGEFKLLQ